MLVKFYEFSTKAFLRNYLIIILLLLCLSLFQHFLSLKGFATERILNLFNLNEESNIPTFFSALGLLLSSLLSFIIFTKDKTKSSLKKFWLSISIIFVYLSLDEIAMFHEKIYRISNFLNVQFGLPLVWYAPYSVFLVFLFIFLLRDLLKLTKKTQRRFFLSFVIYFFGAVILEHIGNNCYFAAFSCSSNLKFLIYNFEEVLELVGICIFNYFLLKELNGNSKKLRIEIHI